MANLSSVSRARKRRRKYAAILIGIIALLGVIVFSVLGFFSNLDTFELQTVLVGGSGAVPSEDIEKAVWKELDGKYLLIFSKKNTFIFPKRQIEKALLSGFPRLMEARVEFADYHTIRVQVKEREPVALWCKDSSARAEACYFLDHKGFIFDVAPEFSGGLYSRFFGPISGGDPSWAVGNTYIEGKFEPLREFVKDLRGRGLKTVSVSVDQYEDVSLIVEGDIKIMFSLPESYKPLLDDLDAIAATLKRDSTELSSIEYIDMRFPGRAFYKRRE